MLRGLAGVLVGLVMAGGASADDRASARSTESAGELVGAQAPGGTAGGSSEGAGIRSKAGRLIVESSQRVKDGMDLARDSEGTLRRVEVRAEGAQAAGTTVVGRSGGD